MIISNKSSGHCEIPGDLFLEMMWQNGVVTGTATTSKSVYGSICGGHRYAEKPSMRRDQKIEHVRKRDW